MKWQHLGLFIGVEKAGGVLDDSSRAGKEGFFSTSLGLPPPKELWFVLPLTHYFYHSISQSCCGFSRFLLTLRREFTEDWEPRLTHQVHLSLLTPTVAWSCKYLGEFSANIFRLSRVLTGKAQADNLVAEKWLEAGIREYCCCLVTKSCPTLLGTPWTVAHQAPLSMEFSGQGYWSGLPFPSQGNLPDPGIKPASPSWRVDSFLLSRLRSPWRSVRPENAGLQSCR